MSAFRKTGFWGELEFSLPKGEALFDIASRVHHTHVVDLSAEWEHAPKTGRDPDHFRGWIFGHDVTVLVHKKAAFITVGHSTGFELTFENGAYSRLPPNLPGRDVSAAVATLLAPLVPESWGMPQRADLPPLLGQEDWKEGAPPPARRMHFDLEITTPPYATTPYRGEPMLRPNPSVWEMLPNPVGHYVPELKDEVIHEPCLVNSLRCDLHLWLRAAEGEVQPATHFWSEHLGMRIDLHVGTPERPVSRMTGAAPAQTPTDQLLDVGEQIATVVWVLGAGRWTVRAFDRTGTTTFELPADR